MRPGMYAVVEIMGRRQRAGLISDATIGGCVMLRVEHPTRVDDAGDFVTEYYAPAALFAIRPCSEADAAAVNAWAWPDPRPAIGPALTPELAELVDDDDRCEACMDGQHGRCTDVEDGTCCCPPGPDRHFVKECGCCQTDGAHAHDICEHPCCPDGDPVDDFIPVGDDAEPPEPF